MTENAPRPGANDRALSPRTLAVQAMGSIDPITKAIVMPLHMATTYVRDPDNQYRSGFSYGRPHNATVREAEAVLATLEGAAGALLFGSGMAAISAVFQAFEAGDHIVAPEVTYTGSRNWLRDEAKRRGMTFARVDTSDLKILQKAVEAGPTKLVWLETPGNPLWTITDIAAAANIAHAAGARLAVDSTVATPVLTNPLALGADIVMHSATKYLNGHSDVIAGALAFAKRDSLFERLEAIRTIYGGVLGPFEAFLLIRGMRTLHLRVEAQCRTAMFLAEKLAANAAVTRVLYPGLAVSPQPRGRTAPDARRLLGHAFDRGARRRSARHRHGGPRQGVEARDLARRRREPDRAPRLGRRRGHPLPTRRPSPLRRARGSARSPRRSRSGAHRGVASSE